MSLFQGTSNFAAKRAARHGRTKQYKEQLKNKKNEADYISSNVIPELLAEQGLSEIKLADGSKAVSYTHLTLPTILLV